MVEASANVDETVRQHKRSVNASNGSGIGESRLRSHIELNIKGSLNTSGVFARDLPVPLAIHVVDAERHNMTVIAVTVRASSAATQVSG